ncbi:cytochrome c oxidase assembly factor CtaG [Bacillus gobiensis]|uniref:cytochrome c oxidase assembly factor CtaG n=1 Tax=Bacillus gobiensis TaxID=1441095 RepID=UPI003D20570E
MGNLEIFGFRALWSPYLATMIVLFIVAYFLLLRRLPENQTATRLQNILFVSAMILFYVTNGSPLDLLSHIVFSAHMLQMAVLYLLIPPLIILGIPAMAWEKVMRLPIIRTLFRFFSRPLIPLLLFNGFFSLYHLPFLFDTAKTNEAYHFTATALIFVTAFFMWWPLVTKAVNKKQLNGLTKLGYIMANGILLTPACALIMFSDAPLYHTYTDSAAWAEAIKLCVPSDMLQGITLSGPEMFNTLPPLEDQRLGAIVMKVFQEIILGTFLAIVFFDWVKKEREKDRAEQEYPAHTLHS